MRGWKAKTEKLNALIIRREKIRQNFNKSLTVKSPVGNKNGFEL
jgi:hypothetical protein